MRILQVTNGFPPTATAGVEQYTHQLSRGLNARHEVRILCRESLPRCADYDILEGDFDGLPVRRIVNDFRHASQVRDLYLDLHIESVFEQMLAEWQPNLIHFQHCLGLSASLPRIAALHHIPHVLTLHDYWYICSRVQLLNRRGQICPGPITNVDCQDCMFPDGLLRPFMQTWLFRLLRSRLSEYSKRRILGVLSRITPSLPSLRPDKAPSPYVERDEYMLSLLGNVPLILAPSHFIKNLYAQYGVSEERLRVVPLGLELTPWTDAGSQAPGSGAYLRVGYLGSFLRHKGVHILIKAFRRLQTTEARLHIYGHTEPSDPFVGHLRRLAGHDSRIRLMGRYQQRDLPALLAKIDVIVIPSLSHETFSIVAREALLSGTPVIASRIGALPEIILDGRNGLLVAADDENALHHALHRLSTEPGLLACLSDGALTSSKRIKSMDDHVREVDLLYESVVRLTADRARTRTSAPGW